MDTVTLPRPETGAAAPATTRAAPARLLFVDNLRWTMIVLVLAMHAAVTYSGFGRWYYVEHPPLDHGTLFFFATFQAFLQGFFMALLFFVAGVFTPSAYDRKGPADFALGRLVRLGLPTLLYVAVIGPVTEYFIAGSWHTRDSFAAAMARYVAQGWFLGGTGPLWFCAALLIFSLVYAIWRMVLPARPMPSALPTASDVVIAVAVLAAATFVMRVWMPTGSAIYNMQLPYFPHYIIMFALGIAASSGAWLERITDRFAWRAAGFCVGLAAIIWLPMLVLGGAFDGNLAAFNGGWRWQSAAMSSWETLVCVGMSFAVLAVFRARAAGQGPVARFLSANAFAVYVIHPPLLVLLALALGGLAWPALAKFLLLWLLSAALCFGIAAPLVRRIPLVGRIVA